MRTLRESHRSLCACASARRDTGSDSGEDRALMKPHLRWARASRVTERAVRKLPGAASSRIAGARGALAIRGDGRRRAAARAAEDGEIITAVIGRRIGGRRARIEAGRGCRLRRARVLARGPVQGGAREDVASHAGAFSACDRPALRVVQNGARARRIGTAARRVHGERARRDEQSRATFEAHDRNIVQIVRRAR